MASPSAHQRRIREDRATAAPRRAAETLQGYGVALVSRAEAEPIILAYEWLRTLGRATLFVGLVSPSRELEGVVCFGYGPGGPIRDTIGTPALCLERGACVHYAPANAASFLITRACRLIYHTQGVPRFFAYADPEAGEYGGVYQAANWLYLGQGLDGGKGRDRRLSVLAPGRDPDNPAHWQTTRILRRLSPPLGLVEARAQGWSITKREAKHVYACHVGADRRRWIASRLEHQCRVHGAPLPYPAPRPDLKLSGEKFKKDRSISYRSDDFERNLSKLPQSAIDRGSFRS